MLNSDFGILWMTLNLIIYNLCILMVRYLDSIRFGT